MISLAIAALALSSPIAGEPYVSVGMGPYLGLPNIGSGILFYNDTGMVDVHTNFSYEKNFKSFQIGISKLFYVDHGVYTGIESNFGVTKFWKYTPGHQSNFGIVFGKEFKRSFIDFTVQKRMTNKGIRMPSTQAIVRFGVKV